MAEEYRPVKRVLSNIRCLRAFARNCDFDFLEEIFGKLKVVIDEQRIEHENNQKIMGELEDKRKVAIAMLSDMGLTPEDLISDMQLPKINHRKSYKEPKYVYRDENGDEKTWAGVGRKPKMIQAALDAGRSVDEFLIKKG